MRKEEDTIEETIGYSVLLLGVVLFIFAFIWWLAIGMDRSEYKFCMKEYTTHNPDRETSRAFDYCYDETY